jgi:hypothetical protein
VWVVLGLEMSLVIIETLSKPRLCPSRDFVQAETLPKLRFFYDLKLSHFLRILGVFIAGIGLAVRSLKLDPPGVLGPGHLSGIESRNS